MRLPEDLPECLVFLLGKAYQRAHACFKERLKKYQLTNIQHLVLEGLWYKPGLTATELGKMLVLDKATLSGVIERMVEADWLIKEMDQDDRRIFRLYPSAKAEGLKEELIQERIAANQDLLAEFSLEERVLFKRLLKDFIEKNF